ncbi:MAG: CHRD domain-containing protein [Dehalococcoidia bacterium]|nr:CHRD domain-containing protein [Dehalococcoidia bacterium]
MHVPRPRVLIAAALATMAALLPLAVSGQAVVYRAAMVGANEVPPTVSTATGSFTATLDEATGTLTWTLTVPAITNVTLSHLHFGATPCVCPVVLPLFASPTGSPAGAINISGVSRESDLTGPLRGNFADFGTALKAENIYTNVHTTANPIGEIRAVVVPTSGAPGAAAPAQAATPAAPKTGNAGMAGDATSAAVLAMLVVLATGLIVGGRIAAGRRA